MHWASLRRICPPRCDGSGVCHRGLSVWGDVLVLHGGWGCWDWGVMDAPLYLNTRTPSFAFEGEASRVIPQSPHEMGNQKRGLAFGERKETAYFLPPPLSFPPLLSPPLAPKCWQDRPTEDESVCHLPWKRLYLSLSAPSLHFFLSHSLTLRLSFLSCRPLYLL